MEDVGDVGLGGEAAHCRWRRPSLLESGWCLDGGHAELFAAVEETGAGGLGMGFRIAGNCCVAIDDDVTVRDYSSGIELCVGGPGRGRESRRTCGLAEKAVGGAWESMADGRELMDTAVPRYSG